MMDEQQRENLLARYVVGRYRLGYENLALYLACVLFENIINKKLRNQGWDDIRLEKTRLEDKINDMLEEGRKDSLYTRAGVFIKYVHKIYGGGAIPKNFSKTGPERLLQTRLRLHNFRWLRNQVMHGKLDQLVNENDNKKEDLINYIWCELAPESFDDAYKKYTGNGRIIDVLFEHTADYMVRAVDEIDILDKDNSFSFNLGDLKIFACDFDNLYELRRKMVPLKNYLDIWLKENAPFLHTDILTTIDTTSAYIWMPLVSRKKKIGKKAGIYDCSVSLLATPLDLRIYLDFGGYAAKEREIYYDFLSESIEYQLFLKESGVNPGFEVFDIDWYSFIFNRKQLPVWNTDKDYALKKAREAVALLPIPLKDPITWNRSLHGYIFSKFDLGTKGFLDFNMLEPQLKDIIKLFEAYKNYKQRIEREKSTNG